jgi:hypothetical protein
MSMRRKTCSSSSVRVCFLRLIWRTPWECEKRKISHVNHEWGAAEERHQHTIWRRVYMWDINHSAPLNYAHPTLSTTMRKNLSRNPLNSETFFLCVMKRKEEENLFFWTWIVKWIMEMIKNVGVKFVWNFKSILIK